MNRTAISLAASCLLAASSLPCAARPLAPDPALPAVDDSGMQSPLPYVQCVPYARKVSGIQIYGDAHTWWDQAAGRYARGTRPKVGAVMAFRPYGAMKLGHVAAVSRIIDARTVLLRHANWSLIEGRRGQTEDDVRAVDVSPANDWSEVRVWFAPLSGLGTTHWPLSGFIYKAKPPSHEMLSPAGSTKRQIALIGPDFLKGIVPETAPARRASLANDPIGRIIASRLR